MQSGRSVMTSDATADARFAQRDSVVLKRIHSVVAAPIPAAGRLVGLVYLTCDRPERPFGREDLELTTAAAIQLGLATTADRAAEGARRATHGLVKALVAAGELKRPERQGHSERVAHYAAAIAAQFGLSRPAVQRIHLAALLHDVGKLVVPPEPPAGADREAWRGEHVRAGEKIVGAIPGFEDLLPGIRYHHERADGSGFPYGMRNDALPVMARVVAVANTFDLMASYGSGGREMPVKEVLVDLGRNGPDRYDGKAIEALLIAHRNGSLYQTVDVFAP
jgi:HD-GYP domain-containing protein (c-di-GMP phosphodiesterase class II)